MNIKRKTAGLLAAIFMLAGVLGACAEAAPQVSEAAGESQSALPAGAMTVSEAADYMAAAAEGYNDVPDRAALLDGLDESAVATRLDAFVLLSRSFGTLSAPVGANALLANTAVDLSAVPDFALAALENLRDGGALAPADFGQVEDAVGAFEGLIVEDTTGLEVPEGEAEGTDAEGYGIALPEGAHISDEEEAVAGLDTAVTEQDLAKYVKRIYALRGEQITDDFFATVNKTALENGALDANGGATGGSDTLTAETDARVAALITEIAESDADYKPGSDEQKIRDLYRSVLAARPNSTDALAPWMEKIAAADSLAALMQVQLELIGEIGLSGNSLLPFALTEDANDGARRVLNLTGNLMVMTAQEYGDPESDAYLEYRAALIEQLSAVGETAESAETLADEIIAVERDAFQNGMTAAEAANPENTANTMTMDELAALVPAFDVKAFLTGIGFDETMVVQVYDLKSFTAAAAHINEDELARMKAQMKMNLLAFAEPMLTGTGSAAEAESVVSAELYSAVGRLYVERYFSAEAKADVESMVAQIITAYKARIDALDWMADETKTEAKRKLDSLTVLVGYPDTWTENEAEISASEEDTSYFENIAALAREQLRQSIETQHGGGNAFALDTYMVNAVANRRTNTLIFPAGVLQAPFYDPEASFEENLGGIGVTIAHEISHCFDDEGARYNADGAARDWWTEADYAYFEALCEKVAAFYDGAEVAPGIVTDGQYTLSENIADLGGMACALDVLATAENPDYDAFFRAYASGWVRIESRDDALLAAVSDEHAAKKLRVNLVLQNFEIFAETYGIQPGDGMYQAPEARVAIW